MHERQKIITINPLADRPRLDTRFLDQTLGIFPSLVAYFTKNTAVGEKEFLFFLQYEDTQKDPSDIPHLIPTLFAFSHIPGKNYEAVSSTPLEDLLYEGICTQEQFFLMNERLQKRTPGFDLDKTLQALNEALSRN